MDLCVQPRNLSFWCLLLSLQRLRCKRHKNESLNQSGASTGENYATLVQEMNHRLKEVQSRGLLANLAAGLVTGIIAITVSTAFAALIFSGDLAAYAPRGIGLMLIGSMMIATLTALFSSMRGLVAHLQEGVVGVLALATAAIINQMPVSATNQEKFITVVVAMALSSLLTGALFVSFGQFKLGNFIRFIPYPVVGGFLAGSGLLLTLGAISVLTGAPTSTFLLHPTAELGLWMKWLPGILFAVLLLAAMRHRNHVLIVPIMLAAGIAVFYLLLALTNTSITVAIQQGWLLGSINANGGSLWQPLSLTDLAQVNWSAINNQLGSLFFVAIISVIAILLNATGIELGTGQSADLNRDLKAAGIANLAAGLAGSMVGYHASSESTLIYRMGARSRLVGIIPAALCGIVVWLGGPLLSYFPNPILGGLLLFLGLDILVTWVYEAWFKLPITDYLVMITILIAINTIGILEGIGLGVVLGIILFVVDYSRIDIVKHALTGATFHSNVDRPREHEHLLHQMGDCLYVLELQGFIFFGTAQKLLDTVRQRIENRDLTPVRFLVLDFRLVNGFDSSAVLGFAKIKQLTEARGITIVFTHLSFKMQRQMREVLRELNDSIHISPDLDHGIEWCEDRIISALENTGAENIAPTLIAQLEKSLPSSVSSTELLSYFEEKKTAKGDYLIHQGDDSVGLFFIETGQVTVQLEGSDGKITRLRTMQTGTVVGELGFYLGQKTTASVIADEPCRVFYLSADKLKEMENKSPQIAYAFHKFIIGILGERLTDTNETLKALIG
jgi:SulP family sulfate permease